MEKQNKQRLEQLVRQGLVPSRKLPILMQAMSSLHMGKQLTPTERDILSKYMHNMTDIMLKDDSVFNRAKLHTQKTKYQTEETTVDSDNVQDLPEEEGKKYTSYQRAVTNAEKRKAEQKARLKTTEKKPGLSDIRLGNTVGRTAAQTYATPSGKKLKATKYHPGAPDPEAAKRRKAIEKHQAKKQEKDYWDDDKDYNDTTILEKMVDGVEIVDGPEEENKKMKMKKKEKDANVVESREGDEEERMRKKAENKARRLSIRKRDKFRMLPSELKKEKMKAGVEEEVLNFNDMYKEQFEAGLEYYGIDNIRDLPEESKAEFFNLVDLALEEAKMAKKDHDGDGKVETSTAEYMGSRDKAIKKATKPSWDSKQARANALNSLDKKAQARQDMKKEEVEIEEEYTHDDFKKDRIAKVKSTGASGRVIARYRHDDGEIHYTLDHGGNKTSKHPASNLAVHKEEVEIEEDMQVKQAIGIASDKRYKGGNMTGAVNAIEKMRKGLSDHPQVKAVLKRQNEETERLDEYGNPAATPDRLAMIRRAADRVQSGQAAKDVKKIAKADMKQKGAQKGMAPTKKDVKEQVAAIRKIIKEGSTKEKIEAYKELNTIIEQFKSTGEL